MHYVDLDSAYPQRNVLSEDTVTAGTLNGAMNAEVDIWWYELTLGLDWSKTLFGRLDVYALVGATAHALDWEMSHTTSWTVAGADSPATTTRASDDGRINSLEPTRSKPHSVLHEKVLQCGWTLY